MTIQDYSDQFDLITKLEIEKVLLLAFYFYKQKSVNRFEMNDILKWFNDLNFAKPNSSRLKRRLRINKKFLITTDGAFRLHASAIKEMESQWPSSLINKSGRMDYIDINRINEVKQLHSENFDFIRLIRMLEELNQNYRMNNFLSVAMLARAIIDHVPPLFGCATFSEIANNYAGSQSFKGSMGSLSTSLRKIGDSHLHTQVRKKEILPNKNQVDFSNDLDVLLAEVVRIFK